MTSQIVCLFYLLVTHRHKNLILWNGYSVQNVLFVHPICTLQFFHLQLRAATLMRLGGIVDSTLYVAELLRSMTNEEKYM